MRPVLALIAAAFLLAPIAAGAARPAPGRDWSRAVAATPEGGFRMGNPNAKAKLVEYGSLACPHCRHFEETGYPPLIKEYVRTGQVSYEFRNLLLNAPDIAASMLAHCAGPSRFFPMSKAVFDTQPQWMGKIAGITDAQRAEIDKMSDADRIVRLAEIAGFPQIASRLGVTPARSHQCLADPKGLQRLLMMTKTAEDAGISHTPTFLIDGKATDASTWEQLEPLLKKALGS